MFMWKFERVTSPLARPPPPLLLNTTLFSWNILTMSTKLGLRLTPGGTI